ncbi:glycosyl transferase, group 1 [candidate division TM7 genomosp. GTL1]|nr:glycosyl transferase, group 1 [candidate division TM7 genomosp. GTL1]
MLTAMKILFIARRFPPSVGGMQRFAFDLAQSLEAKEDMRRITWGGSNKWLPIVIPVLFFRALWRLTIDPSYTLLHIQDVLLSPVGWLLHVLSGKPFIVVAHGLDVTYENGLYQKVIPWFLRRASAIISISQATADEVVKRGIKPERSHVIPLGIIDEFENVPRDRKRVAAKLGMPELKDKKILLTVGRLMKRKGVAWFIYEVLLELTQQDPSILYLVVGEGSERKAIEAAIMKQGMQEYARLLGEIDDEARNLLYKNADIFVMPNIKVPGDMEGFGRVAHEAAVAGTTVVASSLEGIADALADGKNGILLPTGDKKAYITKLAGLLGTPKKLEKFGTQARTYTLKNFGWGSIAKRYLEIFRHLPGQK